jgi:tyrosyl-tRNA synthetase
VNVDESAPPSIIDLLLATKLCPSKSEAKQLIAGNGLSLNYVRVSVDTKLTPKQLKDGWILLKKGKQKPHLVRFAPA